MEEDLISDQTKTEAKQNHREGGRHQAPGFGNGEPLLVVRGSERVMNNCLLPSMLGPISGYTACELGFDLAFGEGARDSDPIPDLQTL